MIPLKTEKQWLSWIQWKVRVGKMNKSNKGTVQMSQKPQAYAFGRLRQHQQDKILWGLDQIERLEQLERLERIRGE